MRGLISFSLYGHVSKYTLGLYENLEIIRDIYPGWDVRLHIDKHHYAIKNITRRFPWVQIVEHPSAVGSAGMFWRFESMLDTDYTHVIVRDVDSRPTVREALLVDQWIESGKALHCIRDHIVHRHTPVLGGACGLTPRKSGILQQLTKSWVHNNAYGDDEAMLKKMHAEFMKTNDVLAHSSVGKVYGDEVEIDKSLTSAFICGPIVPDIRKHITKLYVINAIHYPNRMVNFLKSLEKSEFLSSLEVVRIEGCTLEQEPLPSWADQEHTHWWLVSQDHKALLKQLILEDTDLALIFEDDGHPNQFFDEYFARAWARADGDKQLGDDHDAWTILMLGGQQDHKREIVSHSSSHSLARATGGYGQHSLLYNYSGLKGFWEHAMYWNYENIDVAFAGYQRQRRNVYCPARWITDIVGVQWGLDS